MYEKLQKRPRNDTTMKPPSQGEADDDEDDKEEMDDEEDDAVEAMDVEKPQLNDGPIVDEDGFQLVQGMKKQRGR
jgi:hypothetical protein